MSGVAITDSNVSVVDASAKLIHNVTEVTIMTCKIYTRNQHSISQKKVLISYQLIGCEHLHKFIYRLSEVELKDMGKRISVLMD